MKDNRFWVMISENPGSFLLLGACPLLAAATNLKSGITLGLISLVLLAVLSMLANALKRLVSGGFRIAVFTLLAVAVCAAAGMVLHARIPKVYETLDVYITLLALAASFFAVAQTESGLSFGAAVSNSLKAGFMYLVAAALTAAICELLGSGSIFGADLEFLKDMKNAVLVQPAGRLMVYGLVAALCGRMFSGKVKEEAK